MNLPPSVQPRVSDALHRLHVLVVDDEPDLCRGLERLVQSTGAAVASRSSAEAALDFIDRGDVDLVISDIKMSGMSGIDLMREVQRRKRSIEVVLITGYGTIEMAVACLQHGAAHFIAKPFDNDEIITVVERIGRKIVAEKEARRTSAAPRGIIAADPKMKFVLDVIGQVSSTCVPVLISGESGTGKELIARAIHAQSECAEKPFLAVNCAALPDTLLESELFGFKRGAFTGAVKDHHGLFRQANGGTVLLDEIPSMSLAFQGKLLRVLQEKIIRPLGATADEQVDFRLIASTNRDLGELVARREFRDDLFYRISVFTINVPPLRDRRDDIPPLAHHFVRQAAALYLPPDSSVPELSHEAMDELMAHPWPGNVRELENTIHRAVITCRSRVIHPHHVLPVAAPATTSFDLPASLPYEQAKNAALERFQRQYLRRILEQTNGNISQAAEACGLTRVAMQKLMRKLNLDRMEFKSEE